MSLPPGMETMREGEHVFSAEAFSHGFDFHHEMRSAFTGLPLYLLAFSAAWSSMHCLLWNRRDEQ